MRTIIIGDIHGCGKGGRLTGMVIEDGKFILHSVAEL